MVNLLVFLLRGGQPPPVRRSRDLADLEYLTLVRRRDSVDENADRIALMNQPEFFLRDESAHFNV